MTEEEREGRDSVNTGNRTSAIGSRWANITRSLKSRNYRLFFLGQGISLIGTWMQRTALLWLVTTKFTDAGSAALWLGVVGFIGQIPSLVLTPLAGVLADRWNRHRMIVAMQILAMLQALVMAALTLAGAIELWQILLLSFWLGAVNAVEIPTRQAFLIEMVDHPDDLSNAIALNSSIVNGGRLIGPALGGLLTALFGAGVCFLVNGLSFFAVLFALLAMEVKPPKNSPVTGKVLGHLVEGVVYALGSPPIRGLLLLMTLICLAGVPYASLLPVFARHLLAGGAGSYGLLVAGVGFGALVAAITLASRSSVRGIETTIATATVLLGAGMIAFSFSRTFLLSLLIAPLLGAGQMLTMAGINSLLQTLVDDDKRGRVMSLYSLAFLGMVPFGNLLAGVAANWFGAPLTVAAGGAICLTGGLFFILNLPALRAHIHPIYLEKGIVASKST